jgi:hypothetical protein
MFPVKRLLFAAVSVLMTALMAGCENPADSSGASTTSRTVSGWADLAAALDDPAVREIDVAEGAGHIIADRAVSPVGEKTLNLPAHTALTLKGLVLSDNLTAAYKGRLFAGPAYLTIQGKVSIAGEKTLRIGQDITCNINDASVTVRGLLAFENESSLPGNTYAVIGGSGRVSLSFDEAYDPYQSAIIIPALGLLLERPLGGTLVTASPERNISLNQDSLVILDSLGEGDAPSAFRTIQIANQGNVETGVLEAGAEDPYLEFEGGGSTQTINSIAVGGGAGFGFRIKAGLPAGIYRTNITVSGFSLRWKSFLVLFEVGASGGLTSLRAVADYLDSGTGAPAQPLNVMPSLNLMYWPRLLELLDEAKNYVSLDLSDCALSALTESTAFNPYSSISAGKEFITSLILPEAAESIPAGTAEAPPFSDFANLGYLEAPNVAGLGAYCFAGCSALETVNLPLVNSIGSYAFSGCSALKIIDLPVLNSIGDYAFSDCSSLKTVDLSALSLGQYSSGTYIFTGCTGLETVILGSAPPTLTYRRGSGSSSSYRRWLNGCATAAKTVTFYIPAASLGDYLSAWTGAINPMGMLNSAANYVWDNDEATRDNLTVRLDF